MPVLSPWEDAGGQGDFQHISRNAEIVVIKDRDVVVFIPETVILDATAGMKIYRGENLQYETEEDVLVKETERVLLWGRMTGTELISGFRWVPYITSDNPDDVTIKPLREVYAPRIVFDKTSNMLHLWFWTNVLGDYDESDYDEEKIYPMGCHGHEIIAASQMSKRVLCYAVGQFGHYNVVGGLCEPFVDQLSIDDEYDMVPIFSKPKIVTNFVSTVEAREGSYQGIITDGCCRAIPRPFTITRIKDNLITFSNCYFQWGRLLMGGYTMQFAAPDGEYIVYAMLSDVLESKVTNDKNDNADGQLYPVALYRIKVETIKAQTHITILCDLRGCPVVIMS